MAVYAVRDPSRDDTPPVVRSWWIHLAAALTLTAAAVTTIVIDSAADALTVPHILQQVLVVSAVGALVSCHVARIRQELAAVRMLCESRLRRAGYAEGHVDGFIEARRTGEPTLRRVK